MGLVKKILKKKVWESVTNKEDWVCIRTGMLIYFGNNANWNKDLFRMWREYIPGEVRDEMIKESGDVSSFVSTYSGKK